MPGTSSSGCRYGQPSRMWNLIRSLSVKALRGSAIGPVQVEPPSVLVNPAASSSSRNLSNYAGSTVWTSGEATGLSRSPRRGRRRDAQLPPVLVTAVGAREAPAFLVPSEDLAPQRGGLAVGASKD